MTVLVSFEKVWTEVRAVEGGSIRTGRQEKVEAFFPDLPTATRYVQDLELKFIPKGVNIWVPPN